MTSDCNKFEFLHGEKNINKTHRSGQVVVKCLR